MNAQKRRFKIFIIVASLFVICASPSLKAEDNSNDQDENQNGLVEVDSNNVLSPLEQKSEDGKSYGGVTTGELVPYKFRRPKWGNYISVTYSLYNPKNYQTDYLAAGELSFNDAFGGPSVPLVELSYCYKRNFYLGSIGGEISYGFYSNDSQAASLGNDTLQVQIIKAGAKYVLDNLFLEPIFAPYVAGGAYTAIYNETQAGADFNGTTGAAGYWGVGVLAQINKLEKSAALEAYTESGIENTFAFAEARQFLASTISKDPDFSTGIDFNFGISVEF